MIQALLLILALLWPVHVGAQNIAPPSGSGGGLASTDIDTCAELAAIWGDETGTCGGVVLSQAPTIVSPIFTTSVLLPNGTAVPGTCSIGMIYFDNDATAGVNLYGCTASNTWTLLGDGGGAAAVATDTIWDAAGDLVYGTGANTAVRLAPGTTGQVLTLGTGPVAPAWSSTLTALTSISFGADPGDGSPLNLSNNTCINWEIATPGTDKCLKVNASDQLDFNGTLNLSGSATGSVRVNGVTSGSLSITTADATAQAITVTGAAQTSGGTTLTIPDMAGVNDTFLFAVKAATLTNKTIDTAGTGNSFTIPVRKYIPAAGCNNATAGSVWNLPTANAPAAACITGTNTQKGVLDFDQTTDESAQIEILLPSTWTGAIDANVLWLSGTTTGSVAWCIQLISSADAETDDPAYPAQATGNCVSDAAKGTANQLNVAALTGITATGVAAGELLHIQISRDPNETSTRTDDHAADARLVGVELIYRVTE